MTKFAAYDDLAIYAIGNTPEEAIENARDAARDYEAQFSTAPITDDFAADIEENGFLGGHDGFRFNERGQLVRA